MMSTPKALKSTSVNFSTHLIVVSREQVTAMKGNIGRVVMPYTCRHMYQQSPRQPADAVGYGNLLR